MSKELEVRNQNQDVPGTAGMDIGAGGELQVAGNVASALQEIQGAMFMAKRFPRNFNHVFGRLMEACQRKTLAQIATYSFPRGGQTVSGPSVNLARVAAQTYGNIRFGLEVLRDDDESMLIRGWAWDVETNTKGSYEDSFKKLIYRKKGGWIKPDERDLRELVNRRGAILVRNALLHVLPRDLIEDAMEICRKTLRLNVKDPKSAAKHLILNFQQYGVTPEMLNGYIGTDNWSADEIVDLTEVYNALKEGHAKVRDFFGGTREDATDKNATDPNALDSSKMEVGDASTHQGYGDNQLDLDAEQGEGTTNKSGF